jgi:four helix bundle protein
MSDIKSHRDLIVWQRSVDLVAMVYDLSAVFPKTEQFRLTSQITAAAASVPGNIAEGYGRESTRDYAHFLAIARGSLLEAETYVFVAMRLGYVTDEAAAPTLALMTEVGKMLTVLRRRLLGRGER